MIFDLETHLIKPGACFPRIVCGAFEDGTLRDRPSTVACVADMLARGTPIEGHNVAFDLGCILSADPSLAPAIFNHYRKGLVRCTMVRGWLIDTEHGCLGKLGGYSLSRLHERACGTALDKGDDTWRLRYSELDGVPIEAWPEAARAYPRDDVAATRRLFDAQAGYLSNPAEETRQAAYSFALAIVAGWGLTTDPVRVDAFEQRYLTEQAGLEVDLRAAGIMRKYGTRDMKAAAALVSAAYGGDPPKTDKGNIQTDALTCREAPHPSPALVAFARFGEVKTQLTKNLPLLRQGLVHTRFGFAASGRSTSDSPNVQNLDKKGGVRECFVPRPGFVYAVADFSTLELCTLAQVELDLFGSSELADALNRGEDPHTSLASSILGISLDEGTRLHVALDERCEEARGACKVANFGFPGGLGAAAFCQYSLGNYGLRIGEERARELKRAWLARWKLSRYFSHVDGIVNSTGTIVQMRSGRVRGRVGYTDGCNTYFQGLGADAAKAALFEVVAATFDRASPLWGSHVVNFVHDSIDTESPEWCAAEAAEEQSRIMVREARKWIPDVRVSAAPLLARYMSKQAKTIRDAGGRLTPWPA